MQTERAPWEEPQWPILTRTNEGRSAAEIAASETRAQKLITEGYGAIASWLAAPPTPEEMEAMQQGQQGQRELIDCF